MNEDQMICGFLPYPDSINHLEGGSIFMTATPAGDRLVAVGRNPGFEGSGELRDGQPCLIAPLSHRNAQLLRELLPSTAPRPGLAGCCSMGVGDRLGVATAGHLAVFKRYPQVFPVLAQQSIRELNLTGRSYEEVLDCVSFAVFKAGFRGGFGADGDHLKKPEEVTYALGCGYSMITLDSSEHIRGDVNAMSPEEVSSAYRADPALEARYLERDFPLTPGVSLRFSPDAFRRAVLIYGRAIAFIADIYQAYITGRPIDFEISIDETMTPTTPLQHYFVASELTRRGVQFVSLAPRFCGEFQKGIDYLGDLKQFESELLVHDAIAKHFGYKLSVHSGSDKFRVFPAVGRLTGGAFHLKTAGTNWLEAVRLVAREDPAFYRRLHAFALGHFQDATRYYHVTTDLQKIPALDSLADGDLPGLMDMNDARQLLHITYGLILSDMQPDGSFTFRDALYALLDRCAGDYAALLERHIGRHLALLLNV
ncbi:MAG: tagaturonate epimerase family protein [Christensenellales bacterium]